MSIIEREIEKREKLIAEKERAEENARELLETAKKLTEHAASINAEMLREEIDELKSYLPKSEADCTSEERPLEHLEVEPELTQPE